MKQTVEEAAKEYSSQWAWNSQPDMWQSEKDFKAITLDKRRGCNTKQTSKRHVSSEIC